MKVWITGAAGQLGRELRRTAPEDARIIALSWSDLDVSDRRAVTARAGVESPDVIVNAAAFTDVDGAERVPDRAYAVNADGAGHLAHAAAQMGAYLVQISTDYVFGGQAPAPYPPEAAPAPLGVYGASKAAGERQVRDVLGAEALILRTAWLYSSSGRNFVTNLLRRLGEQREVAVVDDQVGTPTWARRLACAIWRAVARRPGGTLHWTDAGVASRYDLAVAVAAQGQALGLLTPPVRIRPVSGAALSQLAQRPACAVLDKHSTWAALDLKPVHWRTSLEQMLHELAMERKGKRHA